MPATPSCCDRFTYFLFFSIILTLDAITLECRTTAIASFNLQAKASNSTSSCHVTTFLLGGTSSIASGTSYGSRGVTQGLWYCTEHNEKKYTRTTEITDCCDTVSERHTTHTQVTGTTQKQYGSYERHGDTGTAGTGELHAAGV